MAELEIAPEGAENDMAGWLRIRAPGAYRPERPAAPDASGREILLINSSRP
jgi:hypothetical protein